MTDGNGDSDMRATGTSDAAGDRRGDVLHAALVAGAVFVLWKAARSAKDLAWAAFGLGVAAYWTGFWPF
ncbi:hypothetical protein [Luteimonas saliphila]|uniref:hypothetical protein n=1 Tax=Luteimonas saliphila TaxID=2804919 RepID=UPI001EE15A70|nr:hypothetical protein [Luteimonas saliphila]